MIKILCNTFKTHIAGAVYVYFRETCNVYFTWATAQIFYSYKILSLNSYNLRPTFTWNDAAYETLWAAYWVTSVQKIHHKRTVDNNLVIIALSKLCTYKFNFYVKHLFTSHYQGVLHCKAYPNKQSITKHNKNKRTSSINSRLW